MTSFVGTHPSGRRYYAQAKSGRALAFAVFVRDTRSPGPYISITERDTKWRLAELVEDRPYPDERHRVGGSYVPYDGDMPPRVKAEETAIWYREVIGHHEAVVIELKPTGAKGAA